MLEASQESIRVTSAQGPVAAGSAAAPAGAVAAQTSAVAAAGAAAPAAGAVTGATTGATGTRSAGSGSSAAAASPVGATGSARGTVPAATASTGPASPGPAGAAGEGAAGTGLPAAPAKGGAEIRLGSFGTQTGPLGGILLPLVQGAKAWVADVNARGGMSGHAVRLVMADDGGDPNRALALARRMVEQDKVSAFYAVHSPTAMQAATPYLEQRQIPVIGGCECSPVGDDSPMIFHPGTGAKLGVYWAHLAPLLHYYPEKKKVAILYCREASTCAGIKDGMKPLGKPHGIQWVYEAQVSLAQPDFTAEVLAARNAGAEAIIGIFDNASVIRMLKSADRQDYHPIVSSQQATYEDRFVRDGGDIVNGVVVASPSAPYNTAPQLADYRAAMDRFVPGGIKSGFGGEMWGAGKLLEVL
ncbi:MAG: ABC transporter substrate-binding protein, partial [Actinobacteria bacterium]|nr:ABC transporter substrate-binding protein [Actinomycetota bacterium]